MEQERLAWWNSSRPAPWNKKDGDIPRGERAVDPRGIRNLEPSEAKAGGRTR